MKQGTEIEMTITCNSKEELKAIAEAVRGAIVKGIQDVEKDESDKPEPKDFHPSLGQVCTQVDEEGDVTAIFRSTGKENIDTDDIRWMEADVALEYSGNLMQPYVLTRGEGQEFFANECRPATEEEAEIFRSMEEEYAKHAKDAVLVPKTGQTYWTPSHVVFKGGIFKPNSFEWQDESGDHFLLKEGWVFRTEEECQQLCDKLNEAIKDVKL